MKLFKRLPSLPSVKAPPEFTAPLLPDNDFYVIGDIHGCDSLLETLLEKIAVDTLPYMPQVVCVGDYVDRGENSADVLRRLYDLYLTYPENVVCLKGNHEAMMLSFLDNPERNAGRWLRNGGLQTLASFGIRGISQNMSVPDLLHLRDQLELAMGPDLQAWLEDMPVQWTNGNVSVVHAGADPEKPMTEQKEKTLIWGHSRFLKAPRTDGQWVVHGHIIAPEVAADQGRIGVDTGAYATNRLSAAVISADGLRVLDTAP